MTKQTQELVVANKRIKELEKEVTTLSKRLTDIRLSKFKFPSGKPGKAGRAKIRVIVPDMHGAHIDDKAFGAFLHDLELLKPSSCVILGDILDCGGFLAQHHTMGFVAETGYSWEDDINAANTALDQIQTRLKKGAEQELIEGNHERRCETWCVTQTLRNPKDSARLYRQNGAPHVLHLNKRNINWRSRGEHYDGLQRTGSIRRDKVVFTHGTACGKNAAQKTVQEWGCNVAFGHTHRIAMAHKQGADDPIIAAWSFGCLCRRVPQWYDTNPSDWAHGYGIHLVGDDNYFTILQIPIINGVSLLPVLANALRL